MKEGARFLSKGRQWDRMNELSNYSCYCIFRHVVAEAASHCRRLYEYWRGCFFPCTCVRVSASVCLSFGRNSICCLCRIWCHICFHMSSLLLHASYRWLFLPPADVIFSLLLQYVVIYSFRDTPIYKRRLKNQMWKHNGHGVDGVLWKPTEDKGPPILMRNILQYFEDNGDKCVFKWGVNAFNDQLCSLNDCPYRSLGHVLVISLLLL